ncbi:MAG: hypothetical protein JRG93_18305, partial [Deltaproteobacteria bacterium]|nr:hypothetical protein [Deltaproteobacteria bacterium]
RSKTSEAGANLKSMFQGAAAYYEAENWGQGLTTAGATATASSHCTVDDAAMDNAPSDAKMTPDWPNETDTAAFTAVNFAPADPLYYQYSIDATPNASACGNGPDDTTVYTFFATGDLDNDGNLSTFRLEAGSNPDNSLYRAPGINSVDPLE